MGGDEKIISIKKIDNGYVRTVTTYNGSGASRRETYHKEYPGLEEEMQKNVKTSALRNAVEILEGR